MILKFERDIRFKCVLLIGWLLSVREWSTTLGWNWIESSSKLAFRMRWISIQAGFYGSFGNWSNSRMKIRLERLPVSRSYQNENIRCIVDLQPEYRLVCSNKIAIFRELSTFRSPNPSSDWNHPGETNSPSLALTSIYQEPVCSPKVWFSSYFRTKKFSQSHKSKKYTFWERDTLNL